MRAHWLTRVYLAFLALFPAAYREDYGDELAYAIRSAVADATAEGGQALARLAWRELRDLPPSLLRAPGAMGGTCYETASGRSPA